MFDASFEESALRAQQCRERVEHVWRMGNMDFNAIGRDMHVRYPAFDLVFRLDDGQQEIKPDSLASFRLGLVDNGCRPSGVAGSTTACSTRSR